MTNHDEATLDRTSITPVSFLLERLAEREAEVREALIWTETARGHKTGRLLVKVLADIDAARQAVVLCNIAAGSPCSPLADHTLRALLLPYVKHPNYPKAER